jgi:hypothetical protein
MNKQKYSDADTVHLKSVLFKKKGGEPKDSSPLFLSPFSLTAGMCLSNELMPAYLPLH